MTVPRNGANGRSLLVLPSPDMNAAHAAQKAVPSGVKLSRSIPRESRNEHAS